MWPTRRYMAFACPLFYLAVIIKEHANDRDSVLFNDGVLANLIEQKSRKYVQIRQIIQVKLLKSDK